MKSVHYNGKKISKKALIKVMLYLIKRINFHIYKWFQLKAFKLLFFDLKKNSIIFINQSIKKILIHDWVHKLN